VEIEKVVVVAGHQDQTSRSAGCQMTRVGCTRKANVHGQRDDVTRPPEQVRKVSFEQLSSR
jgi:hypothetical protein